MWVRFGSNAFANVLTGVSAIAFQLGLTALASRSFDAATFSVWTLAVSMAGLTPLFAANLTAVVTRQLVPVQMGTDRDAAGAIMTSARWISRGLAALAVLTILLTSLLLHRASPDLASTDIGIFIFAVLLLTFGQLWQITLQPALGWHYAREQNWPVASALFLVRFSGLSAMWLATRSRIGDLSATALCLALGLWLGVGLAQACSFIPKVEARGKRAGDRKSVV